MADPSEQPRLRKRTITMTVYAIEADQINATAMGEPPDSRYLNGRIVVKAHGEGEHHTWPLRDGERCWPGDTVTVTVIEEAEPFASAALDPPPIDKRR